MRLEAVSALLLDGLEGRRGGPAGTRPARRRGAGRAGSLSASRSEDPSSTCDSTLGRSRHHGVGDALRQNVEAQDRNHDEQARKNAVQRLPSRTTDKFDEGLGQDVAPHVATVVAGGPNR